jgi:hypothetical protein
MARYECHPRAFRWAKKPNLLTADSLRGFTSSQGFGSPTRDRGADELRLAPAELLVPPPVRL